MWQGCWQRPCPATTRPCIAPNPTSIISPASTWPGVCRSGVSCAARRPPARWPVAEKILCVDDELNILLALQRQLRKQFHLDSALGAEKALAAIERDGPYAVIVSDLQMPGMNGLELLAKVKEISPDTVRITLTGQADLNTAIAAVNQGWSFRFLTKPRSTVEMVVTLGAAVGQHRPINTRD